MTPVPLGELIMPAEVARAGAGSYPLMSMTMRDGLVDQSSKFHKRVASSDVSDYKVIRRGQLVVGFPIDEGVLDFQTIYDAGIVSPAYGVWDLRDETRVHAGYLQKFLRSGVALAYYKGKLRGSTARRRSLSAEVFLALQVPLPSLPEQRRIAAILDHADALRAKRHRVLGHLDSLTQVIFHDMFAAYEFLHEFGSVIISGPSNGMYRPASDYGNGIPILRIDGFQSGEVLRSSAAWKRLRADEKEVRRYGVEPGDIIVNRVNALSHLGKAALIARTGEPSVYESNMMRIRVDAEKVEGLFVLAWLQTTETKRQILGKAKKAINQASINQRDVKSLLMPLPPLDSQRTFTARVERINKQRDLVQGAFSTDHELFASLQSHAFRGQL